MRKVILLGDGGHSRVIQEMIRLQSEQFELVGVLDDKLTASSKQGFIRGPIRYAASLAQECKDVTFVVGIGNNHVRKLITIQLDLPLERYSTIIHPQAVISPTARIGYGTVVMANTIINANAHIGNHAILNSSAVIEHDCEVEDYAHLSPRVALAGNVMIKEGAHLGVGCVSIPGQQIGEWSTVGAGASVTTNIPSYCTAVGVPARPIKSQQKEGRTL